MQWSKLIGFGILFYLIIFLVWSILVFLPITEFLRWIVGYMANAIIALVLSKWYFTGIKGVNFAKGLILGFGMLIVAGVLDALITVPLFIKGGYAAFFGQWQLWLSFVIVVLFAGFGTIWDCSWFEAKKKK